MNEIFSQARQRALIKLEAERELQMLDSNGLLSEGESSFSEEQEKEVMVKIFEEIKEVLSGVISEFRENDWEVEFNIDLELGSMVAVFTDTADEVFNINYYVGLCPEDNRKDGISLPGLSFEVGDKKFIISIDHEGETVFGGIGSYRGVLEVTKRLIEVYLTEYFMKTIALGVVEQSD